VLVGEPGLVEVGLELGVEDLLEEVLEAPVVGLHDRVLGRHVDRHAAVQAVAQRGAREVADRLVEVVHGHRHAAAREVEDVADDRLAAVLGREGEGQVALARDHEVLGAVLVAEGVAADDDRLRPPGTRRGMFEMTIGSRKMTPPRMLRIVPLGERYMRLRPNSSTRPRRA
jgi:hypothetical protein